VLSIVLMDLASDLSNRQLRNVGDGRIRYRREFGYRLFDSHGEMATQDDMTAAEFHVMVRALLFELPLTRNPIRYI